MARSAGSNRIASTAMISGTAAMMIAARLESMCCSPAAISGNGIEISSSAYSASHFPRPFSVRSDPARHASASSTTAASTTRDHATNAGDSPSSTAILMNRYETPQSTDIVPNPAHARALTTRGVCHLIPPT